MAHLHVAVLTLWAPQPEPPQVRTFRSVSRCSLPGLKSSGPVSPPHCSLDARTSFDLGEALWEECVQVTCVLSCPHTTLVAP